jgi:hypothetical protein
VACVAKAAAFAAGFRVAAGIAAGFAVAAGIVAGFVVAARIVAGFAAGVMEASTRRMSLTARAVPRTVPVTFDLPVRG